MKRLFALGLALVLLVGVLPMTVSADTEITSADVWMDPPIDGMALDMTCEVTGTPGYSAAVRRWYIGGSVGTPGEQAPAGTIAKAGKTYVVDIAVSSSEGYTLAANAAVKINGTTAMRVSTLNGTDTGVYRVEMTAALIEISAATATIEVPVNGGLPAMTAVSGDPDKYDVVVKYWHGNQPPYETLEEGDRFIGGNSYTVRVNFIAKEGYQLVGGTTYKLNGKGMSSYGMAGYQQVSFAVPTEKITSASVDVTAPQETAKPKKTVSVASGVKATATVKKWYKGGTAQQPGTAMGDNDTFVGGSNYVVEVELLPNEGCELPENATVTVSGKTATAVAFDDETGARTYRAVFTLEKGHEHTPSAWKTDANNHWKVCTDNACGVTVSNKEAHKDQNGDGKCDTCRYTLPKTTTTKKPTTTTKAKVTTTAGGTTTTAGGTTTTAGGTTVTTTGTGTDESVPTVEVADGIPTEPTEGKTPTATTTTAAQGGEGGGDATLWIVIAVIALLLVGGVVIFSVSKKKA